MHSTPDTIAVHIGCEFHYDVTAPTPAVMQVEPHDDSPVRLEGAVWEAVPPLETRQYRDLYGNTCRRFMLQPGEALLRYDAIALTPAEPDPVYAGAPQTPVESLPNDVLIYTMPSRYCLSDVLSDEAWERFGLVEGGWDRVQSICDWVHGHLRFGYGSSTPLTTSADVFAAGAGVCRDFAHLGVTFCRALNIPARYVFGYLPDIDVPLADAPMDFCAWFEAYLDGTWHTFDPRNNQRRVGRVVIGRGRDALDVAMLTTYGGPRLERMTVWADAVEQPVEVGR